MLVENKKSSDRLPCKEFCDLVSLGSVSTVDILHLPHIEEIEDNEKTIKNLKSVFNDHHVAVFAYECLERIRLITRKHCIAAANCVNIQSCPYSDISPSSVSLVELMKKLFELPCNDKLYKELDSEWVQQEGSLRMLSAISSGMIKLLDMELRKSGSSMKTDEWIMFLDSLTESLVKKSNSNVNQVPDIHRAYANFVRARFLILVGENDKAEKELAHIREWTLHEQEIARKKLKRLQADGVMWPQSGVPPRHARLQVSSLLMLMSLQPEGYSQDDKAALDFALESFHMESDEHPLLNAANSAKNDSSFHCSWFLKFPSQSACAVPGTSVHKDDNLIDYSQLLIDAEASAKKWENLPDNNFGEA